MYMMRHLLLLILAPIFSHSLQAAPQDHIDYVPKYRSEQSNVLLSKISYTDRKMMVHFQYITEKEGTTIELSGSGTETPWKLHTPSRSRSGGLVKLGTITDVTLNGTIHTAHVDANQSLSLSPKKGDIITGVVHFDLLPGSIRAIHFTAGSLFVCNDLMIKDATHPLLGTQSQMQGSIDHFHRSVSSNGITIATKEAPSRPTPMPETKKDPELERAEAPIDYAPKQLQSSTDLACNTRVNLKNVYFEDNSASYAGRVEALKTIQIVIDYMRYYPEAQIILHGHTDVHGSSINNLELSKKRVLAVRNTLVTRGIDADRIQYIAHGDSQPLPGKSKGNKKNRRVEVEVLCGDK